MLLTGGSGFVGGAFLERVITISGLSVRAPLRHLPIGDPGGVEFCQVKGLEPTVSWAEALDNVDVVVHAAARVHVLDDGAVDPVAAFREINSEGTLNLARQAVAAGVRRFIFISSVKANGEATALGSPYTVDSPTCPCDPYGISKLEAESGLQALSAETGLEVVVIRPPLVYGRGVKANFLSMIRWVYHGLPLPFGAIDNKRSLVALDNLVDLMVTCIDHPAAANRTFFVSDGEDLSTTQLLRRIGFALGRPALLVPVPVWMLNAAASILGRRDISRKICGSLQVDISAARELLGWQPKVSIDEAMRETVADFLESQNR
nr:SDR family oxidoreductase [Pseudomonas insulae]